MYVWAYFELTGIGSEGCRHLSQGKWERLTKLNLCTAVDLFRGQQDWGQRMQEPQLWEVETSNRNQPRRQQHRNRGIQVDQPGEVETACQALSWYNIYLCRRQQPQRLRMPSPQSREVGLPGHPRPWYCLQYRGVNSIGADGCKSLTYGKWEHLA
jgi:hypothetical protein